MSLQAHKGRGGVTLRHWTASSFLFVGGSQRPGPALAGREVGDGRRLNLVASRLRLIKAQLAAPAEVGNETPSR
jgi:hypothetical protein